MSEPLLKITKLKIRHQQSDLVKDLSFELWPGKTLGLVGESGSGKSLSSLAIMGLLPKNLWVKGQIKFDGLNLLNLSEEAFRRLRGSKISMIFQEPMSALNPSMRCGRQVAEILEIHSALSPTEIKKEVLRLFEEVELPRPESIYKAYPHQLSGGQKQRVMIAMAVACKPKLLIADEPTTALDVSVQAGILKLLNKLRGEYGMAMLFISHDLRVVKHVADEILVLHQGETREYGTKREVFENPQDAYTLGLLACRPTAESFERRLPQVRDFLADQQVKREVIPAETRLKRADAKLKQAPLFKVYQLSKTFVGKANWRGKRELVKALDEVTFQIYPGESLGLVGESGSGKTTLGRVLTGLEPANGGKVYFKGKPITTAKSAGWRQLHRKIQIIFQDPFSSLNPRIKIGEAIAEVLRVQRKMNRKEAQDKACQLLQKVGLLAEYYSRYPHEFSGGQRQRIGIARALAMQPEFIVCDESVSALDVSVQAQILNLLNDLKDELGFTYLFISHDLNVVKYFCDRIVVLQNGKLVEEGLAEELYRQPKEAYTRKLIAAVEE